MAFAPLGVGTWAWGDRSTWGMGGYDQDLNETSIREAWEASIERGVGFFDTAEVYGSGESERIIGRLLADTSDDDRSKVVLATKFWPAPWRLRVGAAMDRSLTASLVPDPRADQPAIGHSDRRCSRRARPFWPRERRWCVQLFDP